MKKITNILVLFFLLLFYSFNAEAQCNASFTYSMGTNGEVTFLNTSTTSSTRPHFSWMFGSLNPRSVLGDTTIIFPANGPVDIRLYVYDSLCTSQDNQTIAITNSQPCNITASYTYSIDANGYVHFTNTSITPTNTPVEYWWSLGDGHTTSLENPVTYYTSGGIYPVSLDVWLSLSPSCMVSYSQTVTAPTYTPYPCSNITIGYALVPTPDPNVWTAYTAYPSGASVSSVNAEWNWGDGTTTLGLYPSHTYSSAVVYTICVTITVTCDGTDYIASYCHAGDSNELVQTVNVVGSNSVGLTQFSKNNLDINLFPNPNDGNFQLSISRNDLLDETLNYKIIDIYGKQVREGLLVFNDDSLVEIEAGNLDCGLYYLILKNKSFKFSIIK